MRKFIVKIACKLGLYKFFVKIDTYFVQQRQNKKFKKWGLETLIQADTAFESMGVKMFLIYGTLLGAYRDKSFIPYDCDLDVGVLYEDRPDNIMEIMSKFGLKLKRQFYIKETGVITEEQYEYKGVQIDVFYHFRKDSDTLYGYAARRHETKEWREANETDGFPCVIWPCTKCNFVKASFLGHNFYMPEKAALWCEEVYGEDFMTPVKNWTVGERKTRMQKTKQRLYRRYF